MAYKLPPLRFGYDALEPYIDAETMELHHDKHHQAYVDNANAALEGTELEGRPVEQVLVELDLLPEDKQTAVRNNAGGHANHTLFWEIIGRNGGGEPSGPGVASRTGWSTSSTQIALGDVGQNSSHTMQGVPIDHGRQRPWS